MCRNVSSFADKYSTMQDAKEYHREYRIDFDLLDCFEYGCYGLAILSSVYSSKICYDNWIKLITHYSDYCITKWLQGPDLDRITTLVQNRLIAYSDLFNRKEFSAQLEYLSGLLEYSYKTAALSNGDEGLKGYTYIHRCAEFHTEFCKFLSESIDQYFKR